MKTAYEFTYKLSYDEVYESFLLLNAKWSKKIRIIIGSVLVLITLVMLVGYYMDSQKAHFFLLAIFAILLLYYLIYVPVLKAKRGAAKVCKQNGTYRVKLLDEGKIQMGSEVIEMAGDKDAKVIETESIYVLRTDRMHTFCLPKRIMKNDENDEVRELLEKHMKYIIR